MENYIIQSRSLLLPYLTVIILIFCLVSRILTTIYYIEDPDSLRFALSTLEYDVSKNQPHFPGYPLFCWLAMGIRNILGSFALAFSLIGGLMSFLLVYASIKLYEELKQSSPPLLLTLLLCVNPLLWLMGNRYMPDLSGVAVVMLIFLCYVRGIRRGGYYPLLAQFVSGLLIGVRLSYLPIVLLPALHLLIAQPKKIRQILAGLSGIAIWMIPFLLHTDFQALLQTAFTHTDGHFNDFGGTVNSVSDFGLRFQKLLLHTYADGLGGYCYGRSLATWGITLGLICGFVGSLIQFIQNIRSKSIPLLTLSIIASCVLYTLWVYFYQNIVFKSRHILVLLPFLIWLLYEGLQYIQVWMPRVFYRLLIVWFAGCLIYTTLSLTKQHKEPVAIAQLHAYLTPRVQPTEYIITSKLIRYFLETQQIHAHYLDIDDSNISLDSLANKQVWVIGNLKRYKNYSLTPVKLFFHNPYVNRMWPIIQLSKLETQQKNP